MWIISPTLSSCWWSSSTLCACGTKVRFERTGLLGFFNFNLSANPLPFLEFYCFWFSQFLPPLFFRYFLVLWQWIVFDRRFKSMLFFKLFLCFSQYLLGLCNSWHGPFLSLSLFLQVCIYSWLHIVADGNFSGWQCPCHLGLSETSFFRIGDSHISGVSWTLLPLLLFLLLLVIFWFICKLMLWRTLKLGWPAIHLLQLLGSWMLRQLSLYVVYAWRQLLIGIQVIVFDRILPRLWSVIVVNASFAQWVWIWILRRWMEMMVVGISSKVVVSYLLYLNHPLLFLIV